MYLKSKVFRESMPGIRLGVRNQLVFLGSSSKNKTQNSNTKWTVICVLPTWQQGYISLDLFLSNH